MKVYLKKFGTILTSRQLGREAFTIFEISLNKLKSGEKLVIDFKGVDVFSSSWGDEFLTPLINRYGEGLILRNTKNVSVQATLDMLEKIHDYKFNIDKK